MKVSSLFRLHKREKITTDQEVTRNLVKNVSTIEDIKKIANYKNILESISVTDLVEWQNRITKTSRLPKLFSHRDRDKKILTQFISTLTNIKKAAKEEERNGSPSSDRSSSLIDRMVELDLNDKDLLVKIQEIALKLEKLMKVAEMEKRAAANTNVELFFNEIDSYLADLYEVIEEEGESDNTNERGDYFQFEEEPLMVEVPGKKMSGISLGAHGDMKEHNSIVFERTSTEKARLKELVSKGDIKKRRSAREYETLKKLLSQLTPDERKWFMPPLGILKEDGKFKAYLMEKMDGDFLKYTNSGMPEEGKKDLAEGIIQSLNILIRHRIMYMDVKPANMLYKEVTPATDNAPARYKGMLCDFDSMIDLKPLEADPDFMGFNRLGEVASRTTPFHVPFREQEEIEKMIDTLEDKPHMCNTLLPPIEQRLQQRFKFSIGSSLYMLFTGYRPYPDRDCETFPNCPDHLKNVKEKNGKERRIITQDPYSYINDPDFAPEARVPRLIETSCDEKMAKLIVNLIAPDWSKRASNGDIAAYCKGR